jgi:nicotinamide mononucleotide transporter
MPGFLDSGFIVFSVFNCNVSLLEILGTVTGYACVWLTAKGNVICWPVGIVNAGFFFLLFYQQNLYSDMFLQVYFFATTIYGWWLWTHPRTTAETDGKRELRVSVLGKTAFTAILCAVAVCSAGFGFLISRIHTILPALFPIAAAFPFADSTVATASIVAQVLLSLKKREAWILWIWVDLLATVIYFLKGMLLMSVEYAVFCAIAVSGLLTWNGILTGYSSIDAKMEGAAQ